jgi:hypothetical protein
MSPLQPWIELPPEPLTVYDPRFHSKIFSLKEEKTTPLIKPSFDSTFAFGPDFSPYIAFIESAIEHIIPIEIIASLKNPDSEEALAKAIDALQSRLPLLTYSEGSGLNQKVCINLICCANFTHGVGRYLTDVLSRWLVPGKFLGVCSTQSLGFQFHNDPTTNYFFHQVLLDVNSPKELSQIRAHYAQVALMIRMNILAVQHARQIVATKKLTTSQKKALIQENLSSLIDRPAKEHDNNAFDQMHHFLIQLSAEELLPQIRDKFAFYLDNDSTTFDRDVFYEMQHLALLFRDKFTGIRDLRHISRVISYQYLFRKAIYREMLSLPKERHLSVKCLKTRLNLSKGSKEVLGILIGINVLRENELFEERHIIDAIQHCTPSVHLVKDSYILDQRTQDKIRLFYLEIEKTNGAHFTLEEMKQLRRLLPRELKGHFENVIHPVFMPRNEEEVMRHIVILSKQLKYLRDIPQVVISFDVQTENELAFSVILLRLLIKDSNSVRHLFEEAESPLKLIDLEAKPVGTLRKKTVKEANLFRILIDKKPFLRKDYSLDLFKARQAVSSELARIFGDIRDFNGGMLSKQHEVFHQLKLLVSGSGSNHDFLLENFFYSLTPTIMQSILSPPILKKLFEMLLEALEHSPAVRFHEEEDVLLATVAMQNTAAKKNLLHAINMLKIPSSSLSMTSVDAYDTLNLGFIYRTEDPHQRSLFLHTLSHNLV